MAKLDWREQLSVPGLGPHPKLSAWREAVTRDQLTEHISEMLFGPREGQPWQRWVGRCGWRMTQLRRAADQAQRFWVGSVTLGEDAGTCRPRAPKCKQ